MLLYYVLASATPRYDLLRLSYAEKKNPLRNIWPTLIHLPPLQSCESVRLKCALFILFSKVFASSGDTDKKYQLRVIKFARLAIECIISYNILKCGRSVCISVMRSQKGCLPHKSSRNRSTKSRCASSL